MKQPKIILLLAFIVSLNSCKEKPEEQSGFISEFSTIKVEKRDLAHLKSYPSSITGIKDIAIKAKVSGYISEVLVDEGQVVKKGQQLFKLETQSLAQDASAAKALVNVAQVEVNKLKPLVEKGIIGAVRLETAKSNLVQAKSNYQGVVANIGYANITSPINGFIGVINYRQGSLVSNADAMPLTNVSLIESVYAYFSMNEKDFITFTKEVKGTNLTEKIKLLPKVNLLLADGSLYEHQGTIETIAGQINRQTGSVTFRAIFPNPNRILRSGSSGTIQIPEYYKDVLVIPNLATYDLQGNKHIYKVTANDSVFSKVIITGKTIDNLIIVEEGIKEGDQIIGKGIKSARSGTVIKPLLTTIDSIVQSITTTFK